MVPKKTPCAFPTWIKHNRSSHEELSIKQLRAAIKQSGAKITVIIPGKEVADTIGDVVTKTVQPLVAGGVVSRVVIIDAASKDGTGDVAASHGAEVIQRKQIATELGPSRGKGDALWRALLVTDGDIVAFLDGDTRDPDPAHLMGILGPLILREEIQMVRAYFDRPFKSASGDSIPNEGGRVTEIMARPLLNSFWPDLAGFSQPLAGEFAGRRELLEALPFPVGYGLKISTLIEAYNLVGLGQIAQVDVGCRQNYHQPLRRLTAMAQEIMATAMRRAGHATLSMARAYLPWENGFRDIEALERPPVTQYRESGNRRPPGDIKSWPYPGPPFVNIEGVRMFRDLGGYQTTDGHSIRRGLVFRSGEPSNMTLSGQQEFQNLEIRKIFDLRSPIEVGGGVHGLGKRSDSGVTTPGGGTFAESFCFQGGMEKIMAPVFADEDWLPQQRDDRLKQYASASEGYAKAYRRTLIQGTSAFRMIFEHLAQSDPGPILFHCSAGKDRTGVVSMLLLALAGCDAATIAYEYALNDLDIEWRASAVQRLMAQPGLSGNVDSATNVVRARSEYMSATLEMLQRDFGGVRAYLEDHLQLSSEVIGAVRANLLES